MKIGSLFSGYLGLDMAVEAFYGAQLAWVSDINPGACKILAHRAPDAPNLGDITAIDWSTVELIDILTGGWPCQPFSVAGEQRGAADERALWPEVARAVRTLRPRIVVLENVAAIAAAGELARATADLAKVGYVGQWRCVRASDAGAPHRRERIFIVAADNTSERQQRHFPVDAGFGDGQFSHEISQVVSDSESNGWDERWPESAGVVGGSDADKCGDTSDTDTEGIRCGTARRDNGIRNEGLGADSWGEYEPAIRRWESIVGRCAPPPTELTHNGNPRLSPAFSEWMMGLPEGWVTAVPGLSRNPQLTALGNGVVPQQALLALQRIASTT